MSEREWDELANVQWEIHGSGKYSCRQFVKEYTSALMGEGNRFDLGASSSSLKQFERITLLVALALHRLTPQMLHTGTLTHLDSTQIDSYCPGFSECEDQSSLRFHIHEKVKRVASYESRHHHGESTKVIGESGGAVPHFQNTLSPCLHPYPFHFLLSRRKYVYLPGLLTV